MRLRRWIYLGIAIAASALAWLYLAPQAVGGPLAYVIVTGNSMEPRIGAGDLVLVREALDYQDGEVVAYDSKELNRTVLHRIVRGDEAGFVFKGDNNGFIDPERPGRSQLIGVEWVRVPSAGRIVEFLRVPRNAAVMAGVFALIVLGGPSAGRRRRRRATRHDSPLETQGSSRRSPERVGRLREIPMTDRSHDEGQPPGKRTPRGGRGALPAVGVLAALLVLLILVGIASFTRAGERTVSEQITYSHSGRFSYSADAPKGPLYDGSIQTGDPIFLRVIEQLEVGFQYELSAPSSDVRGSYQLAAVLSDDNGWSRTIPLQEPAEFEGPTFSAHATLDLTAVRRLIQKVQTRTGIAQDTYGLEVRPEVRVEGTVAGQGTEGSFSPAMSFDLQTLVLRYAAEADGASALTPSQNEDVVVPHLEPNRLVLGPLDVPLTTIKTVVLVGVPIVLIPLLILVFLVLGAMRRGESARIHLRHGGLIVPIRTAPSSPGAVLEVEDFESLVKIAVQAERFILHLRGDGGDSYFVEDAGSLYRYKSYEQIDEAGGAGEVPEPPARPMRMPPPPPAARAGGL